MAKPILRIIHHMARTGGTIICKCLGCMEQVVLLSEIHPLGTNYFNPITQAAQWFGLFDDLELKEFYSTLIPFNNAMRLINDKVKLQDKKLVLRDWSHLDYMAVPFLPEANFRPMLYEILAEDFNIIHIATTRHPISQLLSMYRLALFKDNLNVEQYMHGYLKFAQAAKEIGFVRYEDFTYQPDEMLKQMTTALQLQYDPDYKNKWMYYRNITGDSDNQLQQIKPLKMPILESSLRKKFIGNKDYWSALNILGYKHYED